VSALVVPIVKTRAPSGATTEERHRILYLNNIDLKIKHLQEKNVINDDVNRVQNRSFLPGGPMLSQRLQGQLGE
jgi:hypothetical protein